MKNFTVGTKLFCDFHFGGKPEAVCIEVVTPGNGKNTMTGEIRARITKDCRGYKKGEVVRVETWQAVPKVMELPARGYFRRVSTDYEWIKPKEAT